MASHLQSPPPDSELAPPELRPVDEPVPFLVADERRVWPRRLALAAGALVLLVALGLLGWAAGAALEPTPAKAPPVPPLTAHAGSFAVALPGTWRARTAPPPSVAAAVGARAFSAFPASPAFAWVARGRIDHPSLIPRRVRSMVAAPLPSPHRVRLAGRPAWSYAGLRRTDGGHLDLTVAPTRHGVLLVGCEQRPIGLSAAGCGPGVLAVNGPPPLEPVAALALRLHAGPVLRALRAHRRAGTRALHRARNHRRQATAARRLATAHATAAAALAPFAAPTRSGRRLVASLRRLRAGYAALARAARHDNPRRYRAAGRRIRRADRALRTAVAALAGRPAPAKAAKRGGSRHGAARGGSKHGTTRGSKHANGGGSNRGKARASNHRGSKAQHDRRGDRRGSSSRHKRG